MNNKEEQLSLIKIEILLDKHTFKRYLLGFKTRVKHVDFIILHYVGSCIVFQGRG